MYNLYVIMVVFPLQLKCVAGGKTRKREAPLVKQESDMYLSSAVLSHVPYFETHGALIRIIFLKAI